MRSMKLIGVGRQRRDNGASASRVQAAALHAGVVGRGEARRLLRAGERGPVAAGDPPAHAALPTTAAILFCTR